MNDPGLNQILKWSIENSDASRDTNTEGQPRTQLDPELLAQLMGGPSDADRMNDAMAAVYSDEVNLENKLIAWDNFEQLVENLDNANNIENLGLWMPLVGKLDDSEAEVRTMCLWCIGTAVQNNIKCQERVSLISSKHLPREIRNKLLTIPLPGSCNWCHTQSSQTRLRRPRPRCAQKGNPCLIQHISQLPACSRRDGQESSV